MAATVFPGAALHLAATQPSGVSPGRFASRAGRLLASARRIACGRRSSQALIWRHNGPLLATQEYQLPKGIPTGTGVAGKVQLEGVALPERSVVTVLAPDSSGEVFLDADDEAALLESIAQAERGETISPEERSCSPAWTSARRGETGA